MRYAIVKSNYVINTIVASVEQKSELEIALNCELVEVNTYGLQTGDLYVEGRGWTRNVNGEQTIIAPLTITEYNKFAQLENEIELLEEENANLLYENLTGEEL